LGRRLRYRLGGVGAVGGGMGLDGVLEGPRKPTWSCHCGRPGSDENFASRVKCRGCGRAAPADVLGRAKAADKKVRDEKAAAAAGAKSSKGPGSQDKNKAYAKLEQEIKQLKDKVKEQDEGLREAKSKDADKDAGMDVDDGELANAVSTARDNLKALRDLAEGGRQYLQGGYDACLAARQAELDAALAAKRAANPLGKQLEGAESHKARMLKKVADEKSELEDQRKQLEEMQQQVACQERVVAEAERKATAATAEVAELAEKFACERRAAAGTAAEEVAASAAVPGPVPADCVTREYAEKCWQDREVAFQQQIDQLTASLAAASQAGSECASVAGDLDALEEAEPDEEAWSKAEGPKRKAWAARETRRQHAELATNIRGKLGKVASVRSPFGRK
jgi:DNA repair exonuclease SbcCD ATPase subunit